MSKRAATGVVVRSHEEEDVNELRARVNELEATLVRLQEEKESIYKDSREKANKISKLQNQLKTLKVAMLILIFLRVLILALYYIGRYSS